MKTVLIAFHNPETPIDGEYISSVVDTFLSGGVPVTRTEILSVTDDLAFRRSLETYKDTADNLIVINNDQINFSLKQIIADIMDTALVENDNALKFLEAVSKCDNVSYDISNAMLPIDSTIIPNILGPFQGFMLEREGFTVVLLPQQLRQFKVAVDRYLLKYFEEKFEITRKRLVLKYFGDKKLLEEVLFEALSVGDKPFKYNITEKFGDITLTLLIDDMERGNQIIRFIVEKLKDNIYAEEDASLGERLFDLLRIKKLRLATAESFTGGRVVSSVIANSGASSIVHEGIVCYSNESKSARLGIPLSEIAKDGAVSSMTAYKMASGLLREGRCDVAISTTGVAGPNPDGDKPVGLAYIGIGMMDGIHTYKLTLNGNREEITERAKNTALFLAIKKIKNMR